MKTRTQLGIDTLENRWCPSVTAALKGSTLVISGSADNGAISVVQDSTTAGTFQVLDGTTAVGDTSYSGVKNIRFNLTEADDEVKIDLGGQTLAGSIAANLGDGANSLSVTNGGIAGRLTVAAANGDDTVTLG